jgi:hypothetical protein
MSHPSPSPIVQSGPPLSCMPGEPNKLSFPILETGRYLVSIENLADENLQWGDPGNAWDDVTLAVEGPGEFRSYWEHLVGKHVGDTGEIQLTKGGQLVMWHQNNVPTAALANARFDKFCSPAAKGTDYGGFDAAGGLRVGFRFTLLHKTANVQDIEVKTDPIVISKGDRPSDAPVPRKDLAGLRVKSPASPELFVIDPDGLRRYIPNPGTYNSLFRDWNGIVVDINVNEISRGADLTSGAVLVRAAGTAPVYLISNGQKRWITSPAVMDKYHFNWNTVLQVPAALVDFIPTGANWS